MSWFIREWNDVLDLEGLCGAFGALAAASEYMFHNLSKLAAAAALPSAFVFTVVQAGDLLCLVGAFTDLFCVGRFERQLRSRFRQPHPFLRLHFQRLELSSLF